MAVNLSPVGGVAAQFFDNAGNVLTGGKLFTYAAGTTTPQTAYTTSAGNVAWSNPIILDAAGRVSGSGEIWLTDGTQYKFILRDSNDVLIATYDNVVGINSNFVNFTNEQEIQTATAGQTVFNLTTVQYSPGTNSLSVFVDGVNQYGPGAQYAYLETDSDTVTFVNGLHVGALVKFTTSQLNSSGAVDAEQVSYTPPFSGSVSTNVEAKLAQTVSFKDFGAVGDGVTDDKAAVLAALQSGYIVDGSGLTYAINGTCAPSSFVGLQNANFIQIGNNTATNFQTLRLVGLSNFFIDNVTINMGTNITTLANSGNAGLEIRGLSSGSGPSTTFTYVTNFKITRVNVTGNGCGNGIYVAIAKQFNIDNCYVYDRIAGSSPDPVNDCQNGIVTDVCSEFVLSNSRVKNLLTSISGVNTLKFTRGFLFVESSDFTMVGCNATTTDQNYDFSGSVLDTSPSSYQGNTRFTVTGCVSNDSGIYGFKFANVTHDGVISNCIANNSRGIAFIASAQDPSFTLTNKSYVTQNLNFVNCKVVNVLGTNWAGLPARGFNLLGAVGYPYPRGIKFSNCEVVDNQLTPTTAVAFASGVTLPEHGTAGFDENIANIIEDCSSKNVTSFNNDIERIGPTVCEVSGTANQSVPNSTFTELDWNFDILDPNFMHSTTSNEGLIYVRMPGCYRVSAKISFRQNASGLRSIRLVKNGTFIDKSTVISSDVSAGYETSVLTYYVDYAEVGTYYSVEVSQSSGGALDIVLPLSYLSVEKIG
jgi:hypothetical protein